MSWHKFSFWFCKGLDFTLQVIKSLQHFAPTEAPAFRKVNDDPVVSIHTFKELLELVMTLSLGRYKIDSLDGNLCDIIHF